MGPATIEHDGFSGMTVSSTSGGDLIVRDRLMQGWTATIDGEATEIKAEGPFRKVTLPEGGGTVEFRYTPPGLLRGLLLFALGLLVILAAGISSRIGQKTDSREKEA
jgi:uncharacterized membrane protein YfhO